MSAAGATGSTADELWVPRTERRDAHKEQCANSRLITYFAAILYHKCFRWTSSSPNHTHCAATKEGLQAQCDSLEVTLERLKIDNVEGHQRLAEARSHLAASERQTCGVQQEARQKRDMWERQPREARINSLWPAPTLAFLRLACRFPKMLMTWTELEFLFWWGQFYVKLNDIL